MAYNLGNAYINIVPRTAGMGKGIEKELAGVGERAGSSKGKGLGGKLFGGLKVAAGGAGVAIGGVLAGSITKGFSRLRDIENAEAKLTGLGHSAETVEGVMKNALASVKGTSFGLGEAAGLAGTLVASGIKPGKELEKTLRLTADSATIAGRELGDMGLIWGSVAAKGKLQGDDAMQLLASGVPIWQMVGDVMGKTAAEAQELGAKGEVSFDIFRQAMEQGVGGAAQKAGNTTQGAFKNMGAAMGRFGATLLKDIYPLIGPVFGKITEWFDYLDGAAGPVMETITGKVAEFGKGVKGVWDVLVNGDFTGRANLFGFEEDSAFVDFLFKVRDGALELYERALKPLGMFIKDNIIPIFAGLGAGALYAGITAVVGAISGAIAAAGGLSAVISAAVGAIAWVPIAIGAAIAALVWFFRETEAGQAIFSKIVSFVRDTLVPGIVTAFTAVKNFVVEELWPMFKSRFEAIRDLAVQVWQGVIQPAFEQFVGFVRDTMGPIIQRLWTEYVQPAFMAIGGLAVWLWGNAIKPAMSAFDAFIGSVLGPVIVWLWKSVVSPIFGLIGKFIGWVWNTLIFPYLDAFKYVLTVVMPPALRALWSVVKTVWSRIQVAIRAVVSWFQTWAWPVISLVIELIKRGFGVMRDALKAAWGFVRDRVIAPVVNWFRATAWPVISRVIDSIKSGFNLMRDVLRSAWNTVRNDIIAPVANWFRDKIEPLFKRTTDSTGRAFTSMKDSIKKAWDGVKAAAKAPVKFVVETVVNDALIGNFNKLAGKLGVAKLPSVSLPSGFARGGVLPGWSRMSDGDDQLVPMRRGEGVLVSEGLRRPKDKAAFLAVNAAARRGVGFSDMLTGAAGFAGGGILGKAWKGAKDLAGHALDKVLDGIDFVAEAIKDPKGIFAKVFNAVAGEIPGAGFAFDAAKQAGKNLLDGIVEQVTGAFTTPAADGGMAVGEPPAGASRSLGYAQRVARTFGLTMTSFRRPGARTAGSGVVSLHAQGRAMDFSNSSGPTPQMMAFFDAMHPLRPTELLYSPAGGRQWRRSGRMSDTTGATKRMHYNHVHVGFRDGGWTGPGSKNKPAGIVHADEHVIRKESRASIERARPGFLDRLNRHGAAALGGYARGGLVGYANGGRVSPSAKIGSSKVTVILDGLVGTEKQVKTAAGKLADGIAKTFRDRFKANQKETVNRLSDSLKALKAQASQLNKTIAKRPPKASVAKLKDVQKQIASTEAALKQARRGNTSAAATKAADAFFTKYAASATAKLQSLAKQSDSLNAKLKTARASLTDAMKVRDEYASSLTEKFAGGYALSADSATTGIETIIRGFKNGASTVKLFASQLGQLRSKGLSSGLIDQIAQLGADDGSKVARNLLSGTDAQVREITKQFNALNAASAKSGKTLGSQMHQAGVDTARGLVRGLQSQLSNVEKAADNLANKVVSTVRKKLKIKSPSRVFAEIGEFTGEGMVVGIERVTPDVQSAMSRLATPPEAYSGGFASGGSSAPAGGVTITGGQFGYSPDEIGRGIVRAQKKQEALYAL